MNVKFGGHIVSSYTNGEGCRTVFFLAGCPHGCPGCHNEHLWDKENGTDIEIESLYKMIDKASIIVDGITISGGEPFEQANVTLALIKYAKSKGLNAWVYTGYLYEDLLQLAAINKDIDDILQVIDVLVDGKFVKELASPELKYIGSANQRIIKFLDQRC